ncbi:MAG: HAMP domain-containing histidine kinase [Deltaproteobacteria bacterium]|nr:HAMP domain-containing histidine kinase [Kofleriaceae bacterium]
MRFPPAIIQLRRAQLVLMLAVLVPTILLTALGVIMLATGSSTVSIAIGVLVLAFTTTAVTGYILGSIFVGKGASLARLQNDFFSSVSHELRTPLTSIRLLMESLADGRLGEEERRQVIALLSREVSRLENLLVRTLDLSRIQAGRHAFDMQPLPVSELAAEAIAAFDAATLSRPTPIALDLEPGLMVVGDRDTLTRAVVNLLVNSWKYTGDDKRITLRARTNKRRVEILVEDNGIGLEPNERRELFEGFTRGKAAIDRRAPGVGLGLAIVRAIVRAHRGTVDVAESTPGKGSTFRITLRPSTAS